MMLRYLMLTSFQIRYLLWESWVLGFLSNLKPWNLDFHIKMLRHAGFEHLPFWTMFKILRIAIGGTLFLDHVVFVFVCVCQVSLRWFPCSCHPGPGNFLQVTASAAKKKEVGLVQPLAAGIKFPGVSGSWTGSYTVSMTIRHPMPPHFIKLIDTWWHMANLDGRRCVHVPTSVEFRLAWWKSVPCHLPDWSSACRRFVNKRTRKAHQLTLCPTLIQLQDHDKTWCTQ